MKTKIMTVALLSGLVLGAGAAQAENNRERPDFATLDANGDGGVTLEEMLARGEARFAEMDTDGDGALSAAELAAFGAERAAERAARMIARFDDNEDGLLQQDEMPSRGEGRAAQMFDRVDADSDGVISAEEFEAAKARMGERRGQGRGEHRGEGRRDRG